MTGRIDRLIQDRGFGFILTDDERRVWFHARMVANRPFDDLVVGERVRLDVERDQLGRDRATIVEVQ